MESQSQTQQPPNNNKNDSAYLVGQWLRICLPMQGPGDQSLVQEDPTCLGNKAHVPHLLSQQAQLLKPACLEPVLCNMESHRREKPE